MENTPHFSISLGQVSVESSLFLSLCENLTFPLKRQLQWVYWFFFREFARLPLMSSLCPQRTVHPKKCPPFCERELPTWSLESPECTDPRQSRGVRLCIVTPLSCQGPSKILPGLSIQQAHGNIGRNPAECPHFLTAHGLLWGQCSSMSVSPYSKNWGMLFLMFWWH